MPSIVYECKTCEKRFVVKGMWYQHIIQYHTKELLYQLLDLNDKNNEITKVMANLLDRDDIIKEKKKNG